MSNIRVRVIDVIDPRTRDWAVPHSADNDSNNTVAWTRQHTTIIAHCLLLRL